MDSQSTKNVSIPGLIEEKNSKMTKAEVQAMRDQFTAQQEKMSLLNQQTKNVSYNGIENSINQSTALKLQEYAQQLGLTNQADWIYQPYVGDQLIPQRQNFPPWEEPKKYGPSPSRHGGDYFDQQAILDQIAKLKHPKKSAFEELIDQLFTTAEKEQFLIDAGYMIDVPGPDYRGTDKVIISRKLSDGTVKFITTPLDELFLKEITVKFKNLLLAKATLKLKL